jgi:hypothetical protein
MGYCYYWAAWALAPFNSGKSVGLICGLIKNLIAIESIFIVIKREGDGGFEPPFKNFVFETGIQISLQICAIILYANPL